MQSIIYVASPASQQIHVLQLTAQGQLKTLQVVNVGAVGQPMALSADHRYLYIGVRPDFAVQCYQIAEQGYLTYHSQAALPASPTHISLDRTGRFLFAASYNGNCLSVSPLHPQDGRVLPVTQTINQLAGCHSANMDNHNQQLLAPCLLADTIAAFTWQASHGQLQPASRGSIHSKAGAGPRHMAYHPNNRYAYCVNELNSQVDIIELTQQGNRIIASYSMLPASFTGKCWAADIHLTADARHLYCCDRTSSLLTAFAVNSSGNQLSLLEHYPTQKQPRGFAITADDQFIIVAGQLSNAITLYQRLASGRLKTRLEWPVGQGPMWVTVLAQS